MSKEMNCRDSILEIPNYCYGEMESAAEEALEAHLAECAACKAELARHRKYLALLDERAVAPDPGLLAECRASLHRSIHADAPEVHRGISWSGFVESLRAFSKTNIPFRIPVGAMALVALGFVAARYTPEKFGGVRAALSEPMFFNVRSIEHNASGQVQIAVDETRRRVVSGAVNDPEIQTLLVNGVRDGSNPNVRLQSIQVLHDRVLPANSEDSDQVRQALLSALEHDPSANVRLKALDGLKGFAADASVRASLESVLMKDENPNVRAGAIELLTAHHDDSVVGVLQNVVQKEDNPYVRAQITRVLAQLKASAGTF